MFKMKKNDYFFIYHKKEMRKSNRQPVPNRKYIQEEEPVIVKPSRTKKQKLNTPAPVPAPVPVDKVLISKVDLKDKYNPDNPFWVEHFYTPDDITNSEYERLTNSYKDEFGKLPIVFYNGIG